jgi:hypothetical protein
MLPEGRGSDLCGPACIRDLERVAVERYLSDELIKPG